MRWRFVMRIRRVAATVLSFWRVAYGAGTWRRIGYAIAAVPVCVVCLVLALAGGGGTGVGRVRRGPGDRSRFVGGPAVPRAARVPEPGLPAAQLPDHR